MRNILFIMSILIAIQVRGQSKYQPPKTESKIVVDTLHGEMLSDPYRWLEDKADSKVIEWTKAQHDYGVNYLQQTQYNIAGLQEEFTKIMDRDYEGVPVKISKRIFVYIKKKGDKHYKLNTIIKNEKKVIFDPDVIDPTGKSDISGIDYIYDGETAAISLQNSGSEITDTYIIETLNGKILYDPFKNVTGYNFTKDQQHAYFSIRSKEDIDKQLPLKNYWIKVGDPVEKATMVGTTIDAKNSYYVYDNRYGDYSFYGENDFYANTLYIRKTGSFDNGKLIFESKDANAYPEIIGTKMYILTNHNAPNKKFMVGDISNPDSKNWKVLISEKQDEVLSNAVVTKNNIITVSRKDVLSHITLYDLNGKKIKELELPEAGDPSGINYDREEDTLYLSINSFTNPYTLYVASAKDFKWKKYYRSPVVVDMSNIVAELKFFISKDGTKVPAIVAHRKDLKLDGNNPTLLSGYGGFQIGIQPSYLGYYAPFLNRGGVYVDAGIRGGNEYGEKWHRDGMLDKKQNCFDDFISCAEWLIKEKYTNTKKLVAEGGSNGGLLMGAMATQRPDLFKAIVCGVPLLDMIRFHKFLIARYWIPEYGSSDNEKEFKTLLKYSPYQNIRMGINTPTMLIESGANDSRVDPLHAKKFAAALQNNPGQIDPIILHMDFDSGHGSGQETQQRINNTVFKFQFIMNQLGIK